MVLHHVRFKKSPKLHNNKLAMSLIPGKMGHFNFQKWIAHNESSNEQCKRKRYFLGPTKYIYTIPRIKF